MTQYHAKYFAYDLTKRGGEGFDRISQSLYNASVDLNPHQVEAALFALHSPLSKGVLLADEVGLGKTIEAGLVLCQFWAERKRRLLVVCPAALRKQWQGELEEKFNLPSIIVDAKSYRELSKTGSPFSQDKVIIVSYHYASRTGKELGLIPWDLAVLDEAHKLRNVYKSGAQMAQNVRAALDGRRKILLTATPLQNQLTELFGLSTLIDEDIFTDLPTFRSQYASGDSGNLREVLSEFCHRTLRRDVKEYVQFPNRKAMTFKFEPTDDEQSLYEDVSAYLQENDAYAFPSQQRSLLIMVARKQLASSHAALRGTLEAIRARLIKLRDENPPNPDKLSLPLVDDDEFELYLESQMEQDDDAESSDEIPPLPPINPQPAKSPAAINRKKLEREIERLDGYIDRLSSMSGETKSTKLLTALKKGWDKLRELGAAEKAVIFTESRRSMEYLRQFLSQNGYEGSVVCFSGGGKRDQDAEKLYEEYAEAHPAEAKTVSKNILIRQAIIDRFKSGAKILIATEAGAEGINLQFCSLLINYDLPWNPQRIEQRIGRCHRYGQQFDVAVVNFLNKRNEADVRVYTILQNKLKLFDGLFGASDEILGAIDSAFDLEKKIYALYQQCRTKDEIKAGFDRLQKELEEEIAAKRRKTRKAILENFDEDVHRLLKFNKDETLDSLNEIALELWRMTAYILRYRATFNNSEFTFNLSDSPAPEIAPGAYRLKTNDRSARAGEILYQLNTPLAEWALEEAQQLPTPCREVTFDLSHYPKKISALAPLKGKSGCLVLERLSMTSEADCNEYLLFSGFVDNGSDLDCEALVKLFHLSAVEGELCSITESEQARLTGSADLLANATILKNNENVKAIFQQHIDQIDRYMENRTKQAERELEAIKDKFKAARRRSDFASNLSEQLEAQEEMTSLDKQRIAARRHIEAVEKECAEKRKLIVQEIRSQLAARENREVLFTLRWKVV